MERIPDDLTVTPDEAVDLAQRLLDEDRPFTAHEVLEIAWKSAPAEQRQLWRALAQLAVGLTHLQRENLRGAVALLHRARDGIREFTGPAPAGLDLTGLARYAADLAERLTADPTAAPVAPPRLRG